MTRRPHSWHIRGTHCTRCNAPAGDRGPCRGGLKHGKALKELKRREKRKRKPKQHDYRRSRFAVGQRVWCVSRERHGVVVAHVRRRVRKGNHVMWRQTPVVRFENPTGQYKHDDEDLTRAPPDRAGAGEAGTGDE